MDTKDNRRIECSLRLPCGGTVRGRIPLAFALEHGPVRRLAKRASESRQDITLDCVHGDERIDACPWAEELRKMQGAPVWVAVEVDALARLRQKCADAIHGHRDCPYVAYAHGDDALPADDAAPEEHAKARPCGAYAPPRVPHAEGGADEGEGAHEDLIGGLHAAAV